MVHQLFLWQSDLLQGQHLLVTLITGYDPNVDTGCKQVNQRASLLPHAVSDIQTFQTCENIKALEEVVYFQILQTFFSAWITLPTQTAIKWQSICLLHIKSNT